MGMMKGLRIGSTSPLLPWSGSFPLPSTSPDRARRYPRSVASTGPEVEGRAHSVSGASTAGAKNGSGWDEGEEEGDGGRPDWALNWAGGLSFQVSTPWWSNLNYSRRRSSPESPSNAAEDIGRTGATSTATAKRREKPRYRRARLGAVIPILCEHAEDRAKESVQAYCDAHNLLCQGMIVIPSELDPGHETRAPRFGKVAESGIASTSESLPLLRALVPQLQRDKGRIVSLELPEAEGFIVASASTVLGAKRKATMPSRAQSYRHAINSQRRLNGIWEELEQDLKAISGSTASSRRSAPSGRVSDQQQRDQELRHLQARSWSSGWEQLQNEEQYTLVSRSVWLGKLAWRAGVEQVRRPTRKVRGWAGWLLDVWESGTGVQGKGLTLCRVRVAPVLGTAAGPFPSTPISPLSHIYPDPAQPWPIPISRLISLYLRARSKMVPAARQFNYVLAANALETRAQGQGQNPRTLVRTLRERAGADIEAKEPMGAQPEHGQLEVSLGQPSSLSDDEPGRPTEAEQLEQQLQELERAPALRPAPLLALPVRAALDERWSRGRYQLGLGAQLEALVPWPIKTVASWVLYQFM